MKNYAPEFPRLLFPDGVTSITNVCDSTKVGILFAVLIASLTKDGRNVFLNIANLSNTKYYDMIKTCKILLSFWAWLKKMKLGMQ